MARLVVVQMVSVKSISENLKQVELLLRGVQEGDLVLLPENFALFSTNRHTLNAAEQIGTGQIQDFLSIQAKLHRCYLVAGSLPLRQNDKIYSSSMAYDPEGHLIGTYNKLHLFDVDIEDGVGSYRESDLYSQGDELVLFDTPLGRVGMAICYDLRFPELFSELRRKGADILLLPAAFTKVTGEVHWLPLLQARAIENQCYIMASNQGGKHENGRQTWGHSMIISPWGEVLAEHNEGAAVIHASVDKKTQSKIRTRMPIIKHQRFSRKLESREIEK